MEQKGCSTQYKRKRGEGWEKTNPTQSYRYIKKDKRTNQAN